jgi:hypothetical protein
MCDLLLILFNKKIIKINGMKRSLFLISFFALLFSQCGLVNNKKQKEDKTAQHAVVKTQEELIAEEKLRLDSIENAAYGLMQKTAFGDLMFGMNKDQVELTNEKRQLLGKYNYNVGNLFNGDSELYSVIISSDGVRAVGFDTDLRSRYSNLYKIVKTKYGESNSKRNFPSIFDVQKTGRYWIDKWELGTKQIQLGIKENNLNSYSVTSKIFDVNMEEIELQRLRDIKNKDVIDASKKF